LGYILGDFFISSSGHPGADLQFLRSPKQGGMQKKPTRQLNPKIERKIERKIGLCLQLCTYSAGES
jgi:hypothetical protein